MTSRDRANRNEKLAALAFLAFVLALASAGVVEYARELDWRLGASGCDAMGILSRRAL